MTPLNALEILLLLSAGAFLLPALVGGRARAIAGTIIGGIAVIGLLVLAVVPATFSDLTIVRETGGGAVALERPAGIPLDPAQLERERAEIERLWQEAELERRLWHTGSVAGGVFIWLAIATAYLKFDLQTAGHYRNRLRLGAAAAALVGMAGSVWAWTIPL
jgi:hypothetical protein